MVVKLMTQNFGLPARKRQRQVAPNTCHPPTRLQKQVVQSLFPPLPSPLPRRLARDFRRQMEANLEFRKMLRAKVKGHSSMKSLSLAWSRSCPPRGSESAARATAGARMPKTKASSSNKSTLRSRTDKKKQKNKKKKENKQKKNKKATNKQHLPPPNLEQSLFASPLARLQYANSTLRSVGCWERSPRIVFDHFFPRQKLLPRRSGHSSHFLKAAHASYSVAGLFNP
mmetsp:Transcript_41498/g.89107  ORF Transcript_41498/g.89107 Transcript_41498/m.89107 type:complete len:227 (-) Transcript_41498:853-1533(-)